MAWLAFVGDCCGGGKRALPDGVRSQLELLDERRFENGVVHLRYRVNSSSYNGGSNDNWDTQ